MLVLTRRMGESIVIADGLITIRVLGVVGTNVRLGIQAPKNIAVHRHEVADRIRMEKAGNELKITD